MDKPPKRHTKSKKPDVEEHTLRDSTDKKDPEWVIPQTEEADSGLPGLGKVGSSCFMWMGFLGGYENVLELERGDGCGTSWNCHWTNYSL